MEPADEWMTTAEAVAYTKRHEVTIRRAAIDGELLSVQRSGRRGHRRYKRSWLDAWMRGERPLPVELAR